MSDNDVINTAEEQPCADCEEYQQAVGILLLLALIGPIIGMLIGMFAGKKLIEKSN